MALDGLIVSEWSTNANENDKPPPAGAPENMAPSFVNNIMRRIMAGTRELADYLDDELDALGTMADQNASAVAITGGSLIGLTRVQVPGVVDINPAAPAGSKFALATPLPIAFGGTGANTAAAALNALGVNNYARMGDLWMAQAIHPRGLISMWAGRPGIDPVPYGFALCDGGTYTSPLNGDSVATPNLTNRVPVAAGDIYSQGSVGGFAIHNIQSSAAGSHAHGGATTFEGLTVAQLPPHSHTQIGGGVHNLAAGGFPSVAAYGNSETSQTGSGQPHGHGINADGNHVHNTAFDNRMPYFGLGFIMKL